MKLNFKKYFSKGDNIFVLSLLVATIVYGLFGFSKKTWKNWEDAAVFFTLVYTIVLYARGFFIDHKDTQKPIFDGLKMKIIGQVVVGFLILIGVSVFQILNIIHEHFPSSLFETPRWVIMLMLFLMASIFSWIDSLIGNGKVAISEDFKKSLYYSDLPVTFAFLILFIYSLILRDNTSMDSFFAGATAFQMMQSNFLWSFMDDKVFDYSSGGSERQSV